MTIILVDDDPAVRRSLKLLLMTRGHAVVDFGHPVEAMAAALVTEPSTLVSNYQMPVLNGVELLQQLRANGWKGRAILMTGDLDPVIERRALEAGYFGVCEKPLSEKCLAKFAALW